MIEKLSTEQIEGMFDEMPFQLLFIDENDRVRYWNNSKARLLEPPEESLGKDARACHKESSLPRLDMHEKKRLTSIDGVPPVLFKKPKFCPFVSRCPYRIEKCLEENPPLMDVGKKHRAACWVDPDTRKERK